MSKLHRHVSIAPEEYLKGERYSEVRHEYLVGRVYTMVGASEAHSLIAGNLHATLHQHLKGTDCRVFVSDMKVRAGEAFYYPDLLVTCDPTDKEPYFKTRPVLVIEVLSESTVARDTLEKRVAYQSLESLQEYVLVAQDKPEIRVYRRIESGWELEVCAEDDVLRLECIGLDVHVKDVFEAVWR